MTEEDLERYGRQMLLPEVGGKGQERLRAARVLMVGLGGLGCPTALYLAAAGVGALGLVDSDRVDPSNLHRQILHRTPDVGRLKTLSAREKLAEINPQVHLEEIPYRLTGDTVNPLFARYDWILDGSDNFDTRYLVNAGAVRAGKPLVWGAVLRWEGQVMTVRPGITACYRCLFPEPPDPALARSCADAGVIGPAAGTIGSLMAVAALQGILEMDRDTAGQLNTLDFRSFAFRRRKTSRRIDCEECGGGRS